MSPSARGKESTISSVLLIMGGVLALIGNALHPHSPDSSAAGAVQALTSDDAWIWVHLAIIVGIVLIIGGLVLLASEFTGSPAEPLARLGVAAALMGGAVVTVSTAVDGFGMKALAVSAADAPTAEASGALRAAIAVQEMDFGIWSIGMLVLFGAAFGCFAAAMYTSGRFPAWYGWLAGSGAAGSTLAALLQIGNGGETAAAEYLFLVASMALTLWVLVVGIRLRRGLPLSGTQSVPERPVSQPAPLGN
jgi:hypothetical protein